LKWRAPGRGFYWNIGVGQLVAGRPQEALDSFQKELVDGNREMGTIMALHDLGRNAEFEARFAGFRNDSTSAESVARIYAWIGDNDKAFEWLNRMVETLGPESVGRIDTDLYAKLKSDPRWSRLRSKHGIEDDPDETIDFTYSLPAGAQVHSEAEATSPD
jgi:hypothetical protein